MHGLNLKKKGKFMRNQLNDRQKLFSALSKIQFNLRGLSVDFKIDDSILIYEKAVEAHLNTLPDFIDEKNEIRFMIGDQKLNTLLMLVEGYKFNLTSN